MGWDYWCSWQDGVKGGQAHAKCRQSQETGGNKAQRHCRTGKCNEPESVSNRETQWVWPGLGKHRMPTYTSDQCRESISFKENRRLSEHQPWKAGDCGATTVTGLVIGADEKGSSEGVLKALVICEHRELMLSASPSTSGTARQTEDGSRQKNGTSLEQNGVMWDGILHCLCYLWKKKTQLSGGAIKATSRHLPLFTGFLHEKVQNANNSCTKVYLPPLQIPRFLYFLSWWHCWKHAALFLCQWNFSRRHMQPVCLPTRSPSWWCELSSRGPQWLFWEKWVKVRGTSGHSVLFSVINYDSVITVIFLQSVNMKTWTEV